VRTYWKDTVESYARGEKKNGQELVKEDTMKLISKSFALACGLSTLLSLQALAQHSGEHIMLAPSELSWTDLPSLPGVKIAIIEGQLNQAVPIMFRLKFPANFKVPPHWHPGIEHITIIRAASTWALEVSSTGRRPEP
jgi:hypothetical protein